MISAAQLHYTAAILGITLAAIGSGIGQGIAGFGSLKSLTRQTTGNADCFRLTIIGLALIEGGAIVALVATLITLFSGKPASWEIAFAELGVGLAIGCAACAISIASSLVVLAATRAVSRQPFFTSKILTFMLISQSLIEAPVVFAFIVGIIIRAQLSNPITLYYGTKLFASGLAIALGSIGPSIGQGLFAYSACTAIGLNKKAYSKLFPFMLLNAALIETPLIFSMVIAILITYSAPPYAATYATSTASLIAAITMGMGTLGSSLGLGYVASRNCYLIAKDPLIYSVIARPMLLVAAFIETCMIYALIIAMVLIK